MVYPSTAHTSRSGRTGRTIRSEFISLQLLILRTQDERGELFVLSLFLFNCSYFARRTYGESYSFRVYFSSTAHTSHSGQTGNSIHSMFTV